MSIKKIKLTNLRNIEYAELGLANRFNLFYGRNGSGKTSVLEAVHLLSMRKSFRTHLSNQIIKNNQSSFTIFAELTDASCLGVEKKQFEPIVVKRNGALGVSMAEIAGLLPIQLINTEGFHLLDSGPKLRRQFIDWGVFHVEHKFLKIWQRFNNALVNRNAILRQGGNKEYLAAWDTILIENSILIAQYRKDYLESFLPVFKEEIDCILDIPMQIEYRRGWAEDKNFSDVIVENLAKDRVLGYTQYGPHKADVRITIYGQPVHVRLSRGQLKLVMCSLRLAQGKHLFTSTSKKCLYLVDDIAAEFDQNHISKLVDKLNSIKAQVLVTGIEVQHLALFAKNQDTKMFHVKQGDFLIQEF